MPSGMPPFICPCGWRGPRPSMSDASEVRVINGVAVMDRRHVALCPLCFSEVRREDLANHAPPGARQRV
jgi:hypothetical protein